MSRAVIPAHVKDIDAVKFSRLQKLRLILAVFISIFISHLIDLGTPVIWVVLAAGIGTLAAGRHLQRGLHISGSIAGHALFFLLIAGVFWLANAAVLGSASAPGTDFVVQRYSDDAFVIGLFYSAAYLSTWFFWSNSSAVTIEALLGSAFFLWLLSGHRNYHIDAPRQVSSLTWKLALLQRFHAEPQHIFIALACVFMLLLLVYFCVSANRPLFTGPRELKAFGKPQRISAGTAALLLIAAFAYFGVHLNSVYSADLSRVTNGVGMDPNTGEGQSSLGFHSAISPTRQPAALVRLEGDYQRNPWSPMLYLREGALSAFNGRELVNGGLAFDQDVPRAAPGQPYLLPENKVPAGERDKVVQSIYLLTRHTAPIGLDIPQKISVLKNPYPERFLHAYQVLSYAPTKSVVDLVGKNLGEESWSPETWNHYLRAPGSFSLERDLAGVLESDQALLDEHQEDLRYLATAKRLTEAADDKVTKAAMVTHFLSQESIYTRNPGHQVTGKGDPVAPYLFAKEKRGYCVHFAHAAVYMMRLLGIPARIATGYLVDLTYAKDGHILLQLGDRHAWPEVYIQGQGWTVFDVTPARQENEPTLIPDEKLLEELMSKLSPAETLLEPVPVDDEIPGTERILLHLASSRNAAAAAIVLMLLFLAVKIFLRWGFFLAPAGSHRNYLAYLSFASLMADLGQARETGETRREYEARLRGCGVNAADITGINERTKYARDYDRCSRSHLLRALRSARPSSRWSFVRRTAAFCSPSSLRRFGSW